MEKRAVIDHVHGAELEASSPASRLIELNREIVRLGDLLDQRDAEVSRLMQGGYPPDREFAKLRADYDRWHSFQGTSFGGVAMAQTWTDVVVWESVLNSNEELTGIVEIGTWQGGFSRYLRAQTICRGLRFQTFDAVVPDRPTSGFQRLDVFAHPEVVRATIREFGEPLVLFCDGGNKPRELATFPDSLLDPRSLIAVHDWGTETKPEDVPRHLEEVYGDFCDEVGSVTRFFRKKP